MFSKLQVMETAQKRLVARMKKPWNRLLQSPDGWALASIEFQGPSVHQSFESENEACIGKYSVPQENHLMGEEPESAF